MTRILFVLMATMMMWTSCSASPKSTEAVSIDSKFTAISAHDNIDVYYTPGKTVKVRIEAPKSVIADVKATVVLNTLKIYTEGRAELKGKEKIKVFVTAPDIDSFMAADNSDIHCEEGLSGNAVAIQAVDNADIRIPSINVSSLSVTVKDNAEVKVARGIMAEHIAVTTTDNAEFAASDVSANDMALSASDNSEIECKGAGVSTLSVTAADNSEIELDGKSSIVSFTTDGQAVIDAEDLIANGGMAVASGNSTIRSRVSSLQTDVNGDFARIKNLKI